MNNKIIIKMLENKIVGCDEIGGMEREKAVYQSVLKAIREIKTDTDKKNYQTLPEAVRLKMLEKIKDYQYDRTTYSYGFYDGFFEGYELSKQINYEKRKHQS